jgi:CHAD domain-containing protein
MSNPDLLLDQEQKRHSQKIAVSGLSPALRRRALILLSYNEGKPTSQVAQEVGLSRGRVCFWRRQFRLRGMDIFYTRNNPLIQTDHEKTGPEAQTKNGENILENDNPADFAPKTETPPLLASEVGTTLDEASSNPDESSSGSDLTQESPFAGESIAEEGRDEHINTEIQEKIISELENAGFEVLMEESRASDLPYPEALKSPGLEAEDTLAEAGRKTLLYHFAEMLRHEKGTRLGEDIEELHDMRVATRRMRAAFDLFEQAFEPKIIRKHLRGLRATGRALGAVRDMDVFIEKANHYMEGLSADQRSGLEILVEAWQRQRETAREAMLVHLNSPAYAEFKRKFNVFVQTPGKGVRLLSPDCPVPPLARDAAPVLIYSRFAAVRAYDQLLQSATLEQLHALRIEFKKLRYAVEFFREILGKESKNVIGVLKNMQDHLGDLNDAQVATQLLSDFLAHMEFSHIDMPLSERRSPEPVVVYLAAKHAERHRLMHTFPQAWEQFIKPEFRKDLALAVAAL